MTFSPIQLDLHILEKQNQTRRQSLSLLSQNMIKPKDWEKDTQLQKLQLN